MRPRRLLALAAVLASGCCCGPVPDPTGSASLPTERRELWRGTIAGIDLAVGAELRAWHAGAHPGPELQWVEGRDFVSLRETVEAANGRLPAPRYDVAGAPDAIEPAPSDLAAARARLAALAITACPIDSGLAYRVGEGPWRVLWILGGRVFRAAPTELAGARCEELAMPERNAWLAANATGATTCLALDEDGDRHAALDCLARGIDADDPVHEPPPADGPIPLRARVPATVDRDALVRRIASDPASMAGYEDRILAAAWDPNDPVRMVAALRPIDVASGHEGLLTRIAASCADPARACTPSMLALANLSMRWGGRPAECARLADVASAVRSRPDPDALARAFTLIRGSFGCDGPALRALALEGLGTATSEDVVLSRSDLRAYSTIDNECRPFLDSGGPAVSGLCRSLPRWAGTWLAARCGPDAIARAAEIASSRPRVPFDPREDQVLDGALRVLSGCDPAGFEAAIAHVPDDAVAIADIRSRDHLRAAYRETPPSALDP